MHHHQGKLLTYAEFYLLYCTSDHQTYLPYLNGRTKLNHDNLDKQQTGNNLRLQLQPDNQPHQLHI